MSKIHRLFVYSLVVLIGGIFINESNNLIAKYKVSELGRVPTPSTFGSGMFDFSPNGQMLATISTSRVILWNLKGRTVRTLAYKVSDENSNYSIRNQFKFSPNQETIAVVSRGELVLLALEGQQLWSLPLGSTTDFGRDYHNYSAFNLFSFSPDGGKIVILSKGRLILSNSKGRQLWNIPIHKSSKVEFHPDGRNILLSSSKEIKIIGLDGKVVARLENQAEINKILLNSNGRVLATLDTERIITWKQSGEKVGVIELKDSDVPQEVKNLYKKHRYLYKELNDEEYKKFYTNFDDFRFTPDGTKIWTLRFGKVYIWSLQGKLLKSLSDSAVQKIVSYPENPVVSTIHPDRVRVWSEDGKLLREFKVYEVSGTDWTQDGQLVATVGQTTGVVKLLDVESGQKMLMYPNLSLWSVLTNVELETVCQNPEISPDNQTLVSECDFFYYGHGNFPYGLRIWNRKGQELWAPKKDGYSGYAFSPDGKTIAIKHGDEITLLDLRRANK